MTASDVRTDLAVVLCTFNGVAHVAEQVRSILGQSTLPGEIRVYDDGSQDDTVHVIRRVWADRDARAAEVRLYVTPPVARSYGAAGNFARAMADSPQPLLALSDQDDVWDPARLESAVSAFDLEPSLEVVASNAVMTDGAGRNTGRSVFEAQRLTRTEREQFRRDDYLPAVLRRNLFPGMTMTVRRQLVELLGPLPDGAMHDYWLIAAAAARGTLRVIPRPLVRYRIHGGNAVGLDPGSRTFAQRVRVKAGAFRAPLTDLPQWTELPRRLAAVGDATAADRLREKSRFELARRFPDHSALARVRSAAWLMLGPDYPTFEFQGRAAAMRDGIRRPDPYVGVAQ